MYIIGILNMAFLDTFLECAESFSGNFNVCHFFKAPLDRIQFAALPYSQITNEMRIRVVCKLRTDSTKQLRTVTL